jgi:hypothetical protein
VAEPPAKRFEHLPPSPEPEFNEGSLHEVGLTKDDLAAMSFDERVAWMRAWWDAKETVCGDVAAFVAGRLRERGMAAWAVAIEKHQLTSSSVEATKQMIFDEPW